jgi:DnaJ-class molecular chaperone
MFSGGNMGDLLSEMFGQFFPSSSSSSSEGDFLSGRRSGRSNTRDSYSKNFQPLRIDLNCTLQDLYSGAVVKIPVKSDILVNGMRIPISRTVLVDIKKGWREGTKVTFPPTENFPKSIVFTVKYLYQKQDFFRRSGDDLLWTCKLTSTQVKNGVLIRLPLLSGNIYEFDTKALIIRNGYKHVIYGAGMPVIPSRGGGFGDVVIKFQVSSS